MGTAAIVIANLLIDFQTEIRWGFKTLILALGTCGMVAYLRDGVFEYLGVGRWHRTAGGYFEALARSATVFTLLLAFRVARLISCAGDEENRTFNAFRSLDLLARRGVIDARVCDCVLRVDAPVSRLTLRRPMVRRGGISSRPAPAWPLWEMLTFSCFPRGRRTWMRLPLPSSRI